MFSARFRPWSALLARLCGDHVLRIAAVKSLMRCGEGSLTGLTNGGNLTAQTMISFLRILGGIIGTASTRRSGAKARCMPRPRTGLKPPYADSQRR